MPLPQAVPFPFPFLAQSGSFLTGLLGASPEAFRQGGFSIFPFIDYPAYPRQ